MYLIEYLPSDPRMLKQENMKSFFNNVLLCRIEDSDVKVRFRTCYICVVFFCYIWIYSAL